MRALTVGRRGGVSAGVATAWFIGGESVGGGSIYHFSPARQQCADRLKKSGRRFRRPLVTR
jgi:hypothetical protein